MAKQGIDAQLLNDGDHHPFRDPYHPRHKTQVKLPFVTDGGPATMIGRMGVARIEAMDMPGFIEMLAVATHTVGAETRGPDGIKVCARNASDMLQAIANKLDRMAK